MRQIPVEMAVLGGAVASLAWRSRTFGGNHLGRGADADTTRDTTTPLSAPSLLPLSTAGDSVPTMGQSVQGPLGPRVDTTGQKKPSGASLRIPGLGGQAEGLSGEHGQTTVGERGGEGGRVDMRGGVSAALGVTLPSVVITRASGLLAAGSEPDVLEAQDGGSGGTAISSKDTAMP